MLATSWDAQASLLVCNETADKYSLVKMERSAWLEIVNSSGVTVPPSALVELENPLLIAGIVGSVAVAGVAAAAVMALGTVALTVGLMWYFGVFNSHHDRRRKYDTNPSCESTDPLDTNDPDCFTIRWNKMSWYYPHHNALHRGQRLIVTGEDEIETVLEQISDKAQHNQDRLVGHGGTMWRPSKTEGVYHDLWLDGVGTDHLVFAEDNIVGSLYDSESVMGQESESDYQKLKQRFEKAREALLNDAEARLATQEQSVMDNTDRMTGQATKILKDSMEDMLARQSDAAYRFVDVGRELRASSADSIRTQSGLNKRMDSVGAAMRNVEDRISNSFEAVQSLTESQLTKSGRELQSLAEEKQRIFSDKVALLLNDLSSKSIDQAKVNRDMWTNFSRNSTNDIKNLADSADVTVQQASRNISELISNESDALSSALQAGQAGQFDRGRHRAQTMASIGAGGSLMSQQVVSETDSMKVETDELMRIIDAQVLNLISQAKHETGSVGPDGVGSLIGTLGNIQDVAARKISKSKIDYDGSITSVLRSLGQNGLDTSESVRDLYSALTHRDNSTMRVIDDAKLAGTELLRKLQSLSFPQTVKNNASVGTHSDEVRRVLESVRTAELGVRSSIKGNQTLDLRNALSATRSARAVSQKLLQAMQILTSPGLKKNLPIDGSSQVAGLASWLSGNDDSIASSLDAEIKHTISHLNVSAALNGIDQNRFLQSVVDQLDKKRGVSAARGSISILMELLGAMSEQTSGMVSETEQTTRDGEKRRSSIKSQIGGRLADLGISDTNSLRLLTSALSDGIDSKSDQAISHFIIDIFRDERNQLQQKSDSTMMYHTIDRNTESLARIESVLEAMTLEPDVGVERIETSLVDTEASVGKRLKRLLGSLEEMNATTTSILTNFTKSLADEILKVPAAMLSGLTQLDSDFSYASNDLNSKIRATKEQLAIAETDEEKSAVSRGLVVLTKLRAVQDGVLDSDLITRKMMRSQSLESISTREAALGAMASTMLAIEAVASSIDADDHEIATTDSVSHILADQLSLVLEKVAGEVYADSARNALVAANILAKKLRRSRAREKMAGNSTGIVNNLTRTHSSTVEAELHVSERMKGQLTASWNISSEGIDGWINEVLRDVTRGKALIASKSSDWGTDVLSRLAITRQAVASFLSLFRELGQTQVSQLGRITVGNSEIVSAVDAQMKAMLVASEARTNSTREKSVDVWSRLAALNSSQDDVRKDFQSELEDIIPSIDAINKKTNEDILKLDDLMDTAINAQSEESTNILNVIDHILDSYSDMITSQSA